MVYANQNQVAVVNPGKNNNDIDLLHLFSSVWRVWKSWVLALILVSVIFGVVKASQIIFMGHHVVYSKPIRLTFPNPQKLNFPSGAKFAYSDIVSPAVAQLAFERNNLGDYGFSIADLQRGLSAAPYAPTYPLIMTKYNLLKSDKKLTFEQLNDLQEQMENEIKQATSGEALISLRLDKKELPEAVVYKVLSDIPAIWAEKALNEKGVLDINVQLASVSSLNADLIKRSEGLIAGDLLYEKLALLKKNIKAMAEFEGAQSVKDPVSGMRLMDLSFAVDDLGRYVIGDLISPLRELGLSRDAKSTLYYYEDKANKLKISLASFNRQANALKEVYDSYGPTDRKVVESTKEGQSPTPTIVPQLSADMLDKLVGFSGDAAREAYKQKLNEKWFALTKDIAETEGALSDVQLILSAVQKSIANGGKLSVSDEQYLTKIKNETPQVISQLEGFFGVSDRIYRQLSIESVGVIDQLYIPVTNTILVKKTSIDIKSALLVWIALMFLTSIIVIPVCMMRNAMKARAQNNIS